MRALIRYKAEFHFNTTSRHFARINWIHFAVASHTPSPCLSSGSFFSFFQFFFFSTDPALLSRGTPFCHVAPNYRVERTIVNYTITLREREGRKRSSVSFDLHTVSYFSQNRKKKFCKAMYIKWIEVSVGFLNRTVILIIASRVL